MKYINAKDILPKELVEQISEYIDGTYLYIPKKESNKKAWGENTNYKREKNFRNQHIYEKYLEGTPIAEIGTCYHLSEKTIRRIVLEQKKKMESKNRLIKEILSNWGICYEPMQVYPTAWSINEKFILKKYDILEKLNRNIVVIKTLGSENIPVPKIIDTKEGLEYVTVNDKHYMLMTELEGKNIVDFSKCEDKWFYEFGGILARLHSAFEKCQGQMECWHNSLLGEMNSWIRENIIKFAPAYLSMEDFENTVSELEGVYNKLSTQLIHRDVHLGNFLFHKGKFSGYIDFDLSQINIRIFDICYFLLGLLLEDEDNHVSEEEWYRIVGQVVHGYDANINLSDEEKNAIPCVMKSIEILFTAYFLGIGDEVAAEESARLYRFVKENKYFIHKVVI